MSVSVHSRLLSFGIIEGGAKTVFDALMDVVGPTGTVIFPTYTFYLDSEAIYDPSITESREVGALSEYARIQPTMQRTLCPMHGHSISGPNSQLILNGDFTRSLGEYSAFDEMHKGGFYLLLLGCNFIEGGTFVHHVEASVGVPYRTWVNLKRKIRFSDGEVKDIILRHYAMSLDTYLIKNFSKVETDMKKIMSTVQVPRSNRFSYFMKLENLYECVSNILSIDSSSLVR